MRRIPVLTPTPEHPIDARPVNPRIVTIYVHNLSITTACPLPAPCPLCQSGQKRRLRAYIPARLRLTQEPCILQLNKAQIETLLKQTDNPQDIRDNFIQLYKTGPSRKSRTAIKIEHCPDPPPPPIPEHEVYTTIAKLLHIKDLTPKPYNQKPTLKLHTADTLQTLLNQQTLFPKPTTWPDQSPEPSSPSSQRSSPETSVPTQHTPTNAAES